MRALCSARHGSANSSVRAARTTKNSSAVGSQLSATATLRDQRQLGVRRCRQASPLDGAAATPATPRWPNTVDADTMSCDMATPHEMKTWRRSQSPLKDTAIRPFERTLDLDKRQQPTRNFTMLREMKQRLKDLEGKRGDVSAQINDADISALPGDIEALREMKEAERDLARRGRGRARPST